jgi:hypothetical protein
MARSKSTSRRSAGKKAARTRKRRSAAKKASTTRTRRVAAKKAATTKKRRAAVKKAAPPRKTQAAKVAAPNAGREPGHSELDQRIALVRRNLQELTEQAAGSAGSASEEALSDRIAGQEAELRRLLQERGDG